MVAYLATTEHKSAYTSESAHPSQQTRIEQSDDIPFVKSSEYSKPQFMIMVKNKDINIWYVIMPGAFELIEIDPEQRWFWTPEWQAKEREADDDLAHGRYEEFDNFEDFIDSL